jgi:hypothetical protein
VIPYSIVLFRVFLITNETFIEPVVTGFGATNPPIVLKNNKGPMMIAKRPIPINHPVNLSQKKI